MFNPFQIYRNHKRFLEIQKRAIELVDSNDGRTCHARKLIDDGIDVEINDRRVRSYLSSTRSVAFLFFSLDFFYNSFGACVEPSSSRSNYHNNVIKKIKGLK